MTCPLKIGPGIMLGFTWKKGEGEAYPTLGTRRQSGNDGGIRRHPTAIEESVTEV